MTSGTIIGGSITTMWKGALSAALSGDKVPSRIGYTRELLGQHLILDNPNANLIVSPARKLNYPFSVAEWLWLMLGYNDVSIISAFNSQMNQFSDDGEFLAGSYGPMIVEQLPYIYKTLTADPTSRQAVMTLWRPRPMTSKDVPCTVSFQFLVRNDRLTMLTTMRSNDLWLGFPYDVFSFTQLQRYIAFRLGYQVGRYHHFAGSLHLYDRDIEKAEAVLHEHSFDLVPVSMPFTTRLPDVLKSTFPGLALWGRTEGQNTLGLIKQFEGTVEEPWWSYMQLLAYHFHKDKTQLPAPYNALIR